MRKIKHALGMAWASPVVRTAAQAGLAVVVAAGAGFVDVEVWRAAALAGGAAGLAALQAAIRG
jgi:hypothetical protein